MIGLSALCLTTILTACADTKALFGNIGVELPFSPKGTAANPLMESDVAAYIEDLRAAALQCNANFPTGIKNGPE